MQSWWWKSRQGQDALEQKDCRTRTEFYCEWWLLVLQRSMISEKKSWRQKTGFLSFFYEVKNGHFCSDLVQIQKAIFCKKGWPFCVYSISHFEGHSTQWSQLIVKVMFVRLRMFLKQCSLVQPCTAGFGWHGRQWVKLCMYVIKVVKRLFLTVA